MENRLRLLQSQKEEIEKKRRRLDKAFSRLNRSNLVKRLPKFHFAKAVETEFKEQIEFVQVMV